MSDAQRLVDQLNAFADADSIKDYFMELGVTGYRQASEICPISNWISDKLNCEVDTGDNITVYNSDDIGQHEEFETSEAVKEFINSFDSGLWPELDADHDSW